MIYSIRINNITNYKMKLRNGKEYYLNKPFYDNYIDFDHASKMWRINKISIGSGSFKYKTYNLRCTNLKK